MSGHSALGLLVIVVVTVAWVGVQRAWVRVFPDATDDPDPLARSGCCGGCSDVARCERNRGPGPA